MDHPGMEARSLVIHIAGKVLVRDTSLVLGHSRCATVAGWLRASRERRLREMPIGGVPKSGYFRLQPYSASDHDAFKRLEGADC
jgi:hypothetical protein